MSPPIPSADPRSRWPLLGEVLAVAALLVGCRTEAASGATPRANAGDDASLVPRGASPHGAPSSAPHVAAAAIPLAADPAPPNATALPPRTAKYPWGPTAEAEARLDARFPAPEGFTRGPTPDGSFASFLRTLPLRPAGSPVVDYRGDKLYDDGAHANIAAVVDLDVGKRDLQHCADAVIRLHAEWRYGVGDRAIAYKSVSGQAIPYTRYLAGDRAVLSGKELVLAPRGGPKRDDHVFFRDYLDDVFSWAGTASLERDAPRVPFDDVRGGDFFVLSGTPFGHAVLVLDVARREDGHVALLLGQSYMPAQSFHVLRPTASKSPREAWFILPRDATEVATPFWKPFPRTALRRLPAS